MFNCKSHKWASFVACLIFALVCANTNVYAKQSSSSKKENSAKVKKEKSTSKSKAKSKSKSKKSTPKKSSKKQKTAASDSSVVRIDADDPKAFTKAILYEKQGIEFEVVGENDEPKMEPPKEQKPGEVFDLSSMLIPITHEALLGSPYGVRDHRLHRGVDVNVIKDEPVVAALPGKVTVSKYNKGGYGHYVLVEHENGIQTLYGHLSQRLVNVGDQVFPGDVVGLAGNTGKSSAAHLHFEIRYGDINIDPEWVIDFPKWELKPDVDKLSKKKIINAHYNMQRKLNKENIFFVHKGDTQEDAAKWFNISVDALCRLNGLKKGAPLRVGMKLRGSK